MPENELDSFFEVLFTEENEKKILRLISRGIDEDEILENFLNEDSGGEKT